MLLARLMKKKNKETDIPDFFIIKKKVVPEKQIRDSWDAIAKKITTKEEKGKH